MMMMMMMRMRMRMMMKGVRRVKGKSDEKEMIEAIEGEKEGREDINICVYY